MPSVTHAPHHRSGEPPLRRGTALPVEGVFSAPPPRHPATPTQHRPAHGGETRSAIRPASMSAAPVAAAPAQRTPYIAAPGKDVAQSGAQVSGPEPLLDSIPAIPSAVFSWPGDPAPGFEQRYAKARSNGAQRQSSPAEPAAMALRRPRRDPSPSRLAYRLHRLWLTPFIRRGLTVWLPVCALTLALGLWLGDETRLARVTGFFAALRADFENRPEFQVNSLVVHSESPEVAEAIALRLSLSFPVSSFHIDLEALRQQAEALDAVENAALRIRSGGVLELAVVEREAAMVWRHHGGLDLIDIEGRRIARLAAREARADLPLIAGDGAPAAIAEAQQLLAAASPLRERLRGLVRVGERRWDLVLDRDQRILLPATGAIAALERALAIDAAQDLLSRDVRVVDLRDASRPTIRLSQTAVAELHRIRNQATGVQNR